MTEIATEPRYYWAHINSLTEAEARALLPDADIIVDGDCGSVWGEFHEEGSTCPWIHVIIRNPTRQMLEVLVVEGVGFSADLDPDWGEKTVSWNWTEDPKCIERDTQDRRKPYVLKPERNQPYWPLCQGCGSDGMDEYMCPNSHRKLCLDCCGEEDH